MRFASRQFCVALILSGFLFGCFALSPIEAQNKPFQLPLADPASPSTWLLGQPYGNTLGAYLNADNWYEAGQGLHFGIDFSMPCRTPIVAIGAGEVLFVDDLGFGSAPHNLLIRHPDVGVVSLYGHLYERSPLNPGDQVAQGQVIGESGDPDLSCDSRPHLHLEIRSLDYLTAYNPVDYIEANWHNLSLIGQFTYPPFQQDLDNARQWTTITDQPSVAFGGRRLNDYAATYPDWSNIAPPNPPLFHDPLPPAAAWTQTRLTFDGCCANAWWDESQPGRLYVIDGTEGQRAGIFEWDTLTNSLVNLIGQAPPPPHSPDGHYTLARSGDLTEIRRIEDGLRWEADTHGAMPALSTDNSRLLWIEDSDQSTPEGDPVSEVWVSDADGNNARPIAIESGLAARWLDDTRFLISRRVGLTTTLAVFDTITNQPFVLGAWDRVRGLTVAPGGGRIMFYLVSQTDSAQNGIYAIETRAGAEPQHMDWFGAWRWRDAESVYTIPFDPLSAQQSLHLYNLATGVDTLLIDQALAVADGDWSVSADGTQIAYRNNRDLTLWLAQGRN
ncbi:MAG: M23 family metallopeptidase [Anaerolineae bacterium]